MALFNRPFSEYWQFAKTGVWVLAVVAIIRLLLTPLFGITGTHYVGHIFSLTIFQVILMVYLSVKAAGHFSGYKDLLGIALVLGLSSAVLVVIGIAIDTFGGIATLYNDDAHGGAINVFGHMGAHIVAGFVFSLILWGIGSLTYLIVSKTGKKAIA